MSAALAAQPDYLLFLQGIAFLLLAAVCFVLRDEGPPWWALGVFALLQGPTEWIEVLVSGNTVFTWIGAGLHALALVFALIFARALLGPRWGGAARWLPLLLSLTVAYIGIARGENALVAATVYAFCVPAGLLAGTRLLKHSRDAAQRRKWLAAAGAGLLLYGTSHLLAEHGAGAPPSLPQPLPALAAFFSAIALGAYALFLHPAGARWLYPALTMASLTLILVLGWMATEYLGREAADKVRRGLRSDGTLLTSHVEDRIRAADNAANIISQLPQVAIRVAGKGGPEVAEQVDLMLDSFHTGLGASVVYLMEANGTVVAASNRDQADSFMGKNYAYRPYFRQTLTGQTGQDFALGVTSGERGFYASHPILDENVHARLREESHDQPRLHAQYFHPGRVLGAVVIKLRVDEIEETMRSLHFAFLIDPNGVVFLSSRPDWRFRALWPLSPEARRALLESKQFGSLNFQALLQAEVRDGNEIVLGGERYLAARQPVGPEGWSVLLFSSMQPVAGARRLGMGVVAFLSVLLLGFFVFLQRESASLARSKQQQAEVAKLSSELQRRATTDPLTGAWNRRQFDALLASEMNRARRHNLPLSLIMFDIDHFKAVNDTWGHQAGDDLLAALSVYVSANIRDIDKLARWGGEEFMVITPNTGSEAARGLAEKLRALIEHGDFGNIGKVTCSFGVTQFHPEDTAEDFSGRADAAMYAAKQGGRNRVCGDATPPSTG